MDFMVSTVIHTLFFSHSKVNQWVLLESSSKKYCSTKNTHRIIRHSCQKSKTCHEGPNSCNMYSRANLSQWAKNIRFMDRFLSVIEKVVDEVFAFLTASWKIRLLFQSHKQGKDISDLKNRKFLTPYLSIYFLIWWFTCLFIYFLQLYIGRIREIRIQTHSVVEKQQHFS